MITKTRAIRGVCTIAAVLALFLVDSKALAAVQLLPDLQTSSPGDFRVQVTASGQRRLRFANEVPNTGSGAAEFIPKAEDCNRDGNAGNDRTAYQRLYEDANGNGYFERSIDTSYTMAWAGCMRYHAAHGHWHFEGFARYELRRLSDRALVASSQKVSFCLIDSVRRYPDLSGSPGSRYYDQCGKNRSQGISVGWADVYGAGLPGQWIVVNGVPNGEYCVVSTADPLRRIVETDDSNNVGTRAIRMTGNTVTTLATSC